MTQELFELLKSKNFTLTKMRRLVIEALISANAPITQEEIKSTIKDADKVTVYRTLGKLSELGIVRKFEEEGRSFFELSLEPHAHFICEKCKTIECVKIQKNMLPATYQIKDVLIKGICQNCSIV